MKKRNVELEIESIGFGGKGVAKKDGLVYFVKNAIPGDKVDAFIEKKKKTYVEANVKTLLEPSKDRIEPKCFYFEDCGGCTWQNITYENQLYWKEKHVRDAFERIGKIDTEIREIIPSEKIFNYRNKMDFSFSGKRWLTGKEIESGKEFENKDFALGLHSPGAFDKVIDVKECHIQPEEGNEILALVREFALENNLQGYNNRSNEGFLRELVLRKSNHSNEILLALVTNESDEEKDKKIEELAEILKDNVDTKTNFIHAINATRSPVDIQSYRSLTGDDHLIEDILGLKYKISPFSFFQTNSYQLDKFIGEIVNTVELDKNMTVWDLYCGTGSITLPVAKKVKEIHGLELVESSVNDARENAEFNDIENTNFYSSDLHDKNIPELLNDLPKPDVIYIDPPRAGMHKNLVQHLLTIEADKIVYVSCNPPTQARDCELLSEKYDIEYVQPVDMFPQTYHIEAIALLVKKQD